MAGFGLEGDVHADVHSPRQLLLADAAVYADYALPPHALRENLLVDIASLASGTVLQVGADVRLRLMFQCEACGQLDLMQPGLARRIGARRGVLARVLSGGLLRRGDAVQDLGILQPTWPDDWRERVRRVLGAVPPDAVVGYAQLARLAGIQSSYCRAFPRLLEKLGPAYAGKAVTAQSASVMERWDGRGLFDQA
ncbi:hypothetical protein G4G28_11470 [Massilia sp. Dwa41.01b]|nr:hypothetical protein G4G28_11470 [Massilia sp. Dwa41.01b]QNB01433.1 hypothetical protein G4G31_15105 [Massilia sp. Se16.2.3]